MPQTWKGHVDTTTGLGNGLWGNLVVRDGGELASTKKKNYHMRGGQDGRCGHAPPGELSVKKKWAKTGDVDFYLHFGGKVMRYHSTREKEAGGVDRGRLGRDRGRWGQEATHPKISRRPGHIGQCGRKSFASRKKQKGGGGRTYLNLGKSGGLKVGGLNGKADLS